MTPQSPSNKAPWDLSQFSQLPSAAPSYFPESHQWSEISYLSKVILVLWKATSLRAPHLGCKGAESPGWFDVLPKTLHEMWCLSGHIVGWSCQSPVAHSCGRLNHLNSFRGGMFKLNTKFNADLLLFSVILNAMATQYTCSLNGIYRLYWLVQWSLIVTHAHSSPLSLAARLHWCHANHSHYINNGWTFPRH